MTAGERAFFVESYVPRLDEAIALTLTSRLRVAIAELRRRELSLRWRGSVALAGEETYCWILAAPDLDRVVQVSERAGVTYYQASEVIALDPSEQVEQVVERVRAGAG